MNIIFSSKTTRHIHDDCKFVFVYGSLKKGFSNHNVIKKGKFSGKAKTSKRYPMFKEKYGKYPYMLNISDNRFHHILGELYEINDKRLLQQLDRFEDAPDYYQREIIYIKVGKRTIKAFTYFFKEKIIPPQETPLQEWIEDESYYLQEFESYYKKVTA